MKDSNKKDQEPRYNVILGLGAAVVVTFPFMLLSIMVMYALGLV